jgi:transposase InsO family protein
MVYPSAQLKGKKILNENVMNETQLSKIYRDPRDAGSFGGVAKLFRSANAKGLNVSREKIKEYLRRDDVYTLHKPARKRYFRNQTIVGDIDRQWQADLVEKTKTSRQNNGNKYLLTVVDCFSKFAWVIPTKSKSANDVLDAFKKLFFNSAPRKPKLLQTDKGKEFVNSKVQTYLRSLGIKHFSTNSEMKASMVERFNRTINGLLERYLTFHKTERYMDVLQDLVKNYNNSYHRVIEMKPSEVKPKDVPRIFNKVYGQALASGSIPKARVAPDTTVRIAQSKTSFEKGFRPNRTREVFKVLKEEPTHKRVYKLKDMIDETIAGNFYPEEIQPIIKADKDIFAIEKVVKERQGNKGKEYLVKWQDYDKRYNSWISEDEYNRRRN